MSSLPSLQAIIRADIDRLRLDYKISNATDQTCYAFTLPLSARHKLYPNDAYRCLSADYETFNILLGSTAPPRIEGVSGIARVLPFTKRIDADGHVRGCLEFPVPLREWHAYALREYSHDASIAEVRHIKFVVKYVFEDGLRFKEKTDGENIFYVGGSPVHELIWETTLDHAIGVLIRDNHFQRFEL